MSGLVVYAGLSFKCEGCGGEFYRLTEKFVPTPPMRGDYVELLPRYGVCGYNWYDFPHTEWTVGDNVACVQCGEPIRTCHVISEAVKRLEGLREETGGKQNISGSSPAAQAGAENENVLQGDAVDGDGAGGTDAGGISPGQHVSEDLGLYDEVDLEDGLLATVLRMTAEGQTQAAIAETCGISVYRVRKLQNGELK